MQKVLVVDDEQLVADTLSLIFRKHGFDSRAAYSGEAALEYARDFHPDLLVCDITMPGMDGLTLIGAMARIHPSCRILVLTGYYSNLPRVREQASQLPRMTLVMTKPCSPTELLREADNMLATA